MFPLFESVLSLSHVCSLESVDEHHEHIMGVFFCDSNAADDDSLSSFLLFLLTLGRCHGRCRLNSRVQHTFIFSDRFRRCALQLPGNKQAAGNVDLFSCTGRIAIDALTSNELPSLFAKYIEIHCCKISKKY